MALELSKQQLDVIEESKEAAYPSLDEFVIVPREENAVTWDDIYDEDCKKWLAAQAEPSEV